MEKSYVTLEEAALAGFPDSFARVVRVRTGARVSECTVNVSEDEVEVELATNEPPYEYTYFVHVERHHGRWVESVSHN